MVLRAQERFQSIYTMPIAETPNGLKSQARYTSRELVRQPILTRTLLKIERGG